MAQKLFDKASLVMIPSQYKEGKIYNIKPEDQSSSFEFERGSAATRVNSSGLIEYVGIGSELASNNTILNAGGGVATIDGLSVSALSDGTASSTIRPRIDFNDLVNGETYLITFSNITTTGTIGFSLYNGSSYEFNQQSEIPSQYVFTKNSGADAFIAFNGNVIFTANFDISLKQISNDTPRLDYSGTEPALLLEPQRINLLPYSEDYSQWNDNYSTRISSAEISPNGLEGVYNLQSLVGESYGTNEGFTSSAGNHTCSVYAKANGFDYVKLIWSSSLSNDFAVFNLANGSVEGGTYISANIENAGNGWYRCSMTSSLTGGGLHYLWMSDGTINRSSSVTGDGTKGIYVWGSMVEAGSYATSYIPTNGLPETRLADVCQGGGDASVFNDSEGTLYLELKYPELDYLSGFITISDGTTTDRIVLYMNQQGYKFYIQELGNIITDGSIDVSQYFKVAVKYKSGDNAMFINGSKVGTTNTSTLSSISGLDRIEFQNPDGAEKMKGNIKALHYFPEALTDTELQQLTTI